MNKKQELIERAITSCSSCSLFDKIENIIDEAKRENINDADVEYVIRTVVRKQPHITNFLVNCVTESCIRRYRQWQNQRLNQ